jgi:hypothetical protein
LVIDDVPVRRRERSMYQAMKVGSLDSVTIGRFDYVFIIAVWDEYRSPLREQLDKQSDPFGQELGEKGLVVQAFDNANPQVAAQLLAKDWPYEIRQRIDKDHEPIMVIIDVSFEDFDPGEHQWAIVWFSQWDDKPENLYRVFRLLADKSQADEDVFHYVARIAKKKKFQKWAQRFELKPNFYGIGININAILQDSDKT